VPEHRKLAAIMFTDMVGYTALMGADERKALALLERTHDILRPLINRFHGKWLQVIGDGTLSRFNSAVDAVNCALAIQAELENDPDIKLRIGLHLGDVVVREENIFGDGVNIASRIEPLARPGGVACTEEMYYAVCNQPGIEGEFLGEKELKNVDHPVRVYALSGEAAPPSETADIRGVLGVLNWRHVLLGTTGLILLAGAMGLFVLINQRPEPSSGILVEAASIAVLPLENLSGDAEQEYFVDGIHDELITTLAKIGGLTVISRTSVMQYKTKKKPLPVIAKELNVSSVLEGTVRRAGDRVRVTVQLIDAVNDQHLWGNSYERELTDILALQSDVAQAIAAEIQIELTPQEQARVANVPPVVPEAYEAYLKGRHFFDRLAPGDAIEYFERSVELDPTYAPVFADLADAYSLLVVLSPQNPDAPTAKARAAAEEALELDPGLGKAHAAMANVETLAWNWSAAEQNYRKAIELSPNSSTVRDSYAAFLRFMGRLDEALAEAKRARQLDPLSPLTNLMVGWTYVFRGEYDKASEEYQAVLDMYPEWTFARLNVAIPYAMQGMHEQTIAIFERWGWDIHQPGGSSAPKSWTAIAYGRGGEHEKALMIINELEQRFWQGEEDLWAATIGVLYANLGNEEKAFEWMERSYERREIDLLEASQVWRCPVCDRPRFKALRRKMGLENS